MLLAAVGCCGAALAAGVTGAGAAARTGEVSAAPSGKAAGSPAACTARRLAGAVESSSGAAGTIVLRISLTNRGPACTLAGYPTLRLRQGSLPMPTRTLRGGLSLLEAPANPVELAPASGRAFLIVAYSDRPPGKGRGKAAQALSECPGASAVDLRMNGWQRPVRVRALITAWDGGLLRSSPFLHPARPGPATAAAPPAYHPPQSGEV